MNDFGLFIGCIVSFLIGALAAFGLVLIVEFFGTQAQTPVSLYGLISEIL